VPLEGGENIIESIRQLLGTIFVKPDAQFGSPIRTQLCCFAPTEMQTKTNTVVYLVMSCMVNVSSLVHYVSSRDNS
jgi:hypothetical protein